MSEMPEGGNDRHLIETTVERQQVLRGISVRRDTVALPAARPPPASTIRHPGAVMAVPCWTTAGRR